MTDAETAFLRLARAIGLTDSEAKVFYRISEGDHAREIADLYDVSKFTIYWHTRNVRTRLHVRSDAAVVTLVLKRAA